MGLFFGGRASVARSTSSRWNKLNYDTSLGGFRTDITEDQICGAPTFYRERDYDWSDRQRERELHDYWNTALLLGHLISATRGSNEAPFPKGGAYGPRLVATLSIGLVRPARAAMSRCR